MFRLRQLSSWIAIILSLLLVGFVLFVVIAGALLITFRKDREPNRYDRIYGELPIDEEDLKIYRRGKWMIAELEAGVGPDPFDESRFHYFYDGDPHDNEIYVSDTSRFFELEHFIITLQSYGSWPWGLYFRGEDSDSVDIHIFDVVDRSFAYRARLVYVPVAHVWRVAAVDDVSVVE